MSRSNGRLEPEVIADFGDGYSYSKTKMSSILRAMNDPVKPSKRAPACVRADVDLIVEELEIPRSLAEQALIQNGGNVKAALQALIKS